MPFVLSQFGLQNVLYTQSRLDDDESQKILLDPNKLSEDGTVSTAPSPLSSALIQSAETYR